VNESPPTYAVGERHSFWVSPSGGRPHVEVAAELRLVSHHAYWYVQDGLEVSDEQLRSSASTFDSTIYPRVRGLLGSEAFPGVDNDPRITILNSSALGVAGYISSADGYPRWAQPKSNERQMIYVNARSVRVGSSSYFTTLSHEFTHLVQLNINPGEETWLKEGLGQLVPMLVFPDQWRRPTGFEINPDLSLTAWGQEVASAAPVTARYEAAGQFLAYIMDRFGDDSLEKMLSTNSAGGRGIDAFLARQNASEVFTDLFREWVAANAMGNRPSETGPWYRSRAPGKPLARTLTPAEPDRASVAQFGSRYYDLDAPGGFRLEFSGATTVPLLIEPPVSGSAWYAGAADTALSTLIARADLRNLDRASLSFRIWHDLEPNFDYVYLAISPDGGRSWQLIEADGMSSANPTGNSLGFGYTGRSGNGDFAQWLDQDVDLSLCAGHECLVAFLSVSDDAIQHAGTAIESPLVLAGNGSPVTVQWTSTGWARVGQLLPQAWVVSAIEMANDQATLLPLSVDDNGRASHVFSQGVERAVVAVSAGTPFTLQRGAYEIGLASGH